MVLDVRERSDMDSIDYHQNKSIARLAACCLCFSLLSVIGCNVHSGSFSFGGSNGRTTMIRGSGESREVTVRINDGQSKTEFHSRGIVEFSSDDGGVEKVSANGRFRVKQETDSGMREIEAVPDETGDVVLHYRVDGTSAELDRQGQAWFASMVALALQETPIGAEPRARRILEERGADGLLEEIQHLKNNGTFEAYFEVLLADDDLSPESLARAADVAGRAVSSSSGLSKILSNIAARQPGNEQVLTSVIKASGAISSSSARQECLSSIVQGGALPPAAAIAAIKSAAEISSNSSKSKALQAILDAAPADPNVFTAYAKAVESIASSSTQGEAIEALIERDGVDATSLRRAVEAICEISSSSTKAESLVKLIRFAPNDPDLFRECLDAVETISSSSDQEDVMEAMLRRTDLDRATLGHAASVIKHISSSSTREKLQQRLIERLAEAAE